MRLVPALFALLFLQAASGLAHHSYAEFDRDKTVTIEGAITHLVYGNPHVVLTVQTADGALFTVVWSAPNNLLRRFGMQSTTLKVGDRVAVSGSPNRDPSVRTLSLITEVRRPADGKAWSEPRAPAQTTTR